MSTLEKIKQVEGIISTININEHNQMLLSSLKQHLTLLARQTVKLGLVEEENTDLMKFSEFTIREAQRRLNRFDYYIEGIQGTEFEVANVANANAYIVDFRPSTKQASCTCPDFVNRARICKHIAFVHSSLVSVA